MQLGSFFYRLSQNMNIHIQKSDIIIGYHLCCTLSNNLSSQHLQKVRIVYDDNFAQFNIIDCKKHFQMQLLYNGKSVQKDTQLEYLCNNRRILFMMNVSCIYFWAPSHHIRNWIFTTIKRWCRLTKKSIIIRDSRGSSIFIDFHIYICMYIYYWISIIIIKVDKTRFASLLSGRLEWLCPTPSAKKNIFAKQYYKKKKQMIFAADECT